MAAPAQEQVALPLASATPALSVEVFGASAFWESALSAVATAKKTVLATSLVYDNPKLQAKLVAALARGVKVEVLVDRSSLKEGFATRSRARLQTLKDKGATVFLCSGKSYKTVVGVAGQPGKYHAKVLVVDNAVSFVGSANHTDNSLVNGEVVVKVTGSTALAAKAFLAFYDCGPDCISRA
jgi:phosphatidylserine/phosphatidylglycerophosphate/cardiolipin synthase-like enzyme